MGDWRKPVLRVFPLEDKQAISNPPKLLKVAV
jgi:hypothetical protein